MLKKWHVPLTACVKDEGEEELSDTVPPSMLPPSDEGMPTFGSELTAEHQEDLRRIIKEFNDVLTAAPGRTPLVSHKIETDGVQPVRQRLYRIPYALKDTVKEEIDRMLAMGVIQESTSECASPAVLDTKKDGSVRFCVDFRELKRSRSDAYPMPRVEEVLDRIGRAKFISTMDLSRAYWQVPVDEDSRSKTAFVTEFGLYEFVTMPFGLHGAPVTFQRLMDQVLRGANENSDAFIDDVTVFSSTWVEHGKHLRDTFYRLREAGLTVKPKKTRLGMRETPLLGDIVGEGTRRPDPSKLEAVKDFKQPETKKDVRAFLGLTGYYRTFILGCASRAAALTDLTRKREPSNLTWTPACTAAFQDLKDALCSQPVLSNPDLKWPFVLQVDASDVGLGAVLSQVGDDGEEHPIAYASWKLFLRVEVCND